MNLVLQKGYPDYVGKRTIFVASGQGPAAYNVGGDPVSFPKYGWYIDILFEALSVNGKYSVRAVPSFAGPRNTWKLIWATVAGAVGTVAINSAGSGQTPGVYIVNATGGGGANAQLRVVVGADGTVTPATGGSATLVNSGTGYTSAPTFTMPAGAGGTAATFTATVQASGPVAANTNLSGEMVQIGGFAGQY